MDISFFKQDGGLGSAAPQSEYTYLTIKGESKFMSILQMRGFLDGMDATEAANRAKTIWQIAQTHFLDAATLKTTPFDPNLTLSELTELHLALLTPQGYGWGKATLAGESVNTARKQIATLLKTGRCVLAHSGGVALLNHIVNTPVRDSLRIYVATDKDLDKPITGDLFFRATALPTPPLPVAPDASGKIKLSTWVDDLYNFLSQAGMALQAAELHAQIMAGDLQVLERLRRALQAIYDAGTLGQWRATGSLAGPTPPLAQFAHDCLKKLIVPSSPGGDFKFAWTITDTEFGKNLARFQTSKIDIYKALAKDYKAAPAAHIKLVTDTCDLELGMLQETVGDGDPNKIVGPQLTAAIRWLGPSGTGDPPDAAGGVGILLGMLKTVIPDGVPRPDGLDRLAQGATLLYGTLLAPEVATRAARDAELQGAVATIFGLTGSALEDLKQGGWTYLFTVAGLKKDASAGVRIAQIPKSLEGRLGKLSAANKARFDSAIGWLRAVGFVASALNLVDDILKLHHAIDANGNVSGDLKKLIKDTESTFGSLVRDYAATRLALDKTFNTLTPEAKKTFEAWAESPWTKRGGSALGVVAGVWTVYNGVQKKDILLEVGGSMTVLGYGLRLLATPLILAGIEVAIPLLLIGAALEVWAALNPPAADDCVKDQLKNMVKGVTSAVGEWYAKRYGGVPWRAVDSAAFESALVEVKASASACDGTQWSAFLPYSGDDKVSERARWVEIGFNSGDAAKLVPDENGIKYLGRGSTPAALSPPLWPPTWPKVEGTL